MRTRDSSRLDITSCVPVANPRHWIGFQNPVLAASPTAVAVATGETVTIPTGLVFRSTGYKSVALPGVPFDARSGTIPNVAGRVVDPTGRCVQPSTDARTQQPADARTPIVAGAVPGLYVCGWLKRGPSGIIGTNKWDAEETVVSMLEDVKCGALSARRSSSSDSAVITSNDAVSGSSAEAAVSAAATTGTARSDAAATAADASSDAGASAGGVAGSVGGELAELLRRRGVRTVTFDDWKRIEAEEEARGSRCGKVRCKIETIEEMLEIAQR